MVIEQFAVAILLVFGVVFITMGVFGEVKSFGYTRINGNNYNLINGKYANITSTIVGLVFIVIASIVAILSFA
ncbi:MAG: hypothetical protein ACFCUE_09325 [Candidatus Bathyarchaeia archaeon]|jgi:hypothetical protein